MIDLNTQPMAEAEVTLGHKLLLTARLLARWDLAVLAELAATSAMELAAVEDTHGGLIDFEWRFADPLATWTLGHAGEELCGTRLTQLPDQFALATVLFSAYRGVWLGGQPQSIQVTCGDWSGVHDVRRSVIGVSVLVTSPVEVQRHMAAQRHLHAIELPQPDGQLSP